MKHDVPSSTPSRRKGTRALLAAGTIAAGTVLLAACGEGSPTDGATAEGKEPQAALHSHIHGLGIDPGDGRLYVATHEGIYTADDKGSPQLVGESRDDFMGFTVTGAKTFLASGHPAPGSDQPGNHGLIKSTEAGKSWRTASLKGEADFHSLDHAKGTTYGYDSTGGLLRVSKDGTNWQDRARLQALDFAVNPADPSRLVATTAEGVARSTDGGATFGPGQGTGMEFLSWASPDSLFGVDFTGALSISSDGGTTWTKTATVPGGQPQALTAVDERHILAATQDGIYESQDAGKSFTKRLSVASGSHH
ncbi:exo-alpha-sialidase [Streptomyces sp. P9(2023)]|uniref:F510_1955 family glycosylhydrolase n=1 Tax=Streptomyces sp. P9(2023) TaxID=3064394 RepID=UPI0028F45AFD|nr:exo-alpha-sialidase [Streptomyces sp. P9(2023)]MDT9693589.1 exo-alpha-sialidase [Streptomyces sp. P9(2023)]